MADLGERLQQLLSSPDGMQKLQGAAEQLQDMLGNNGDASAMLSGLFGNAAPNAPPPVPEMDLSLLTKAMPLFTAMNEEDDSVKLLKALRPYMHGDRVQQLDEMIKTLKWFRLAMLLKEKGML